VVHEAEESRSRGAKTLKQQVNPPNGKKLPTNLLRQGRCLKRATEGGREKESHLY